MLNVFVINGKALGSHILIYLGLALFVSAGCSNDPPLMAPYNQPVGLDLPAHFPKADIPDDNPLTQARVILGERLFHDVILSRDLTLSCASCHKGNLAFTDGKPKAIGIRNQVGIRNAPPIFNMAFTPSFNWDGGAVSLELQALVPIQSHIELDMDLNTLVDRLKAHPEYPTLFQRAFGEGGVSQSGILYALAAYQRTLISANSAYDRYLQGESNALTPQELRGMVIFNGEKAECFHCHNGVMFTDFTFQNNGLYDEYADPGRFNVTANPLDIGKFKVPTLRNIAFTAPYMHDGSIATLEDVIEHYASGGKAHPNKSPLVRQFTLTAQEKADLLAFLNALSDHEFVAKHSD